MGEIREKRRAGALKKTNNWGEFSSRYPAHNIRGGEKITSQKIGRHESYLAKEMVLLGVAHMPGAKTTKRGRVRRKKVGPR